MDSYLTLATDGEALFTEKRSKFYAFAYHIESEEDAKSYVAALRKKFYDARHICYAYALGYDAATTRANDDGEPSGSAGKPILGQIRSAGLTFTFVAVVRYFGGVKLGTGGLAVAYKTSAAEAIAAATIEERLVMANFTIEIPYPDADTAMRYIRDGEGEITARDYTDTTTLLTITIRTSLLEPLRERLAKIHTLRFVEEEEHTELETTTD